MQTPLVAILGAGMMGTAIAAAHTESGLPVLLYDSVPEALQRAKNTLGENALVQITDQLGAVLRCPLILETITEKLKAKQKLYRTLMQYEPSALASAPLLFTNTSTISITQLAEVLPPDWRKRFCGFHFFHPVNINPIVEIIAGKETAAETIETAKQHVVRVRKKPICVGDGPGFLVNRILNAYLSAALQLLENGENIARIDQAALDFGMRMGPFRIMDEIGLDVVLHSGWVLHKAFPERVPQSLMLVDLVQNGKHGKKTGQGFYRWSNGEIDDTNSSHAGQKEFDTEKMLINPMRDEAKRCLDDGIISDLSLADFVSVQALGFPSDKVFTNRKK